MRISDWSSEVCSSDLGDGLLFGALDPVFLEVRGLAQAVVVPCFVINIQRSEARHFALGLSQRLVFGSTVILAAGLYLALMAAAAYYVRSIGRSEEHTSELQSLMRTPHAVSFSQTK